MALPAWASAAPRLYVALGDSYTAGPLVPEPKGDPIDCGQSTSNYPTLVAAGLKPGVFRDVSCSSAQTKDMTAPQTELPLGGTNPPQFNALERRVDLVTLGIGGNDMGFGGIVNKCAELGTASGGTGQPCTDYYNPGGVDQIAQRLAQVVAPRLAKVIVGIQRRSPDARLAVVGYPNPVPPKPGCYPALPLAPGDLPYLGKVARNLSVTVQKAADSGGAEFVDLYPGSLGHDICKPPGVKWYEGIVPTAPAYPAHPNVLGLAFAGREALKVLRKPVPNRFSVVRKRGRRGGTVLLRLRAPYRGRFTIRARGRSLASGARLRYRKRSVFAERAGQVKARVKLGRRARARLLGLGRTRVSLRITFEPVAGAARTRRTAVRVGPRAR